MALLVKLARAAEAQGDLLAFALFLPILFLWLFRRAFGPFRLRDEWEPAGSGLYFVLKDKALPLPFWPPRRCMPRHSPSLRKLDALETGITQSLPDGSRLNLVKPDAEVLPDAG